MNNLKLRSNHEQSILSQLTEVHGEVIKEEAHLKNSA